MVRLRLCLPAAELTGFACMPVVSSDTLPAHCASVPSPEYLRAAVWLRSAPAMLLPESAPYARGRKVDDSRLGSGEVV